MASLEEWAALGSPLPYMSDGRRQSQKKKKKTQKDLYSGVLATVIFLEQSENSAWHRCLTTAFTGSPHISLCPEKSADLLVQSIMGTNVG